MWIKNRQTWKIWEVLEESNLFWLLKLLFKLALSDLFRVTDLAKSANLLRPMCVVLGHLLKWNKIYKEGFNQKKNYLWQNRLRWVAWKQLCP